MTTRDAIAREGRVDRRSHHRRKERAKYDNETTDLAVRAAAQVQALGEVLRRLNYLEREAAPTSRGRRIPCGRSSPR